MGLEHVTLRNRMTQAWRRRSNQLSLNKLTHSDSVPKPSLINVE